jgi:hypothetical protein
MKAQHSVAMTTPIKPSANPSMSHPTQRIIVRVRHTVTIGEIQPVGPMTASHLGSK